MDKNIITEGKTTSEAIEKGLKQLHTSKDMVDIKVLEETEKRSFYNILTPRVVKVELTLKEGVVKYEEEKHIYEDQRQSIPSDEDITIATTNVKEFLEAFLNGKDDIKYNLKEENSEVYIDIEGTGAGYLIGYRGETINALQTIISAVANKKSNTKIRIYLDIAGYRNKRIKTLEDLAEKIARTVIKTGKAITLEPMTAYERKVIHTKLQNNNDVKTISKGEEPYRKIVITLK